MLKSANYIKLAFVLYLSIVVWARPVLGPSLSFRPSLAEQVPLHEQFEIATTSDNIDMYFSHIQNQCNRLVDGIYVTIRRDS